MCVKCNELEVFLRVHPHHGEPEALSLPESQSEISPFIIRGCPDWEKKMDDFIGGYHLLANGGIEGLREALLSAGELSSLDIVDRYMELGEPGSWVEMELPDHADLEAAEVCN